MNRFVPLSLAILCLVSACGGRDLPDVSTDEYGATVTSFYQAVAAVQAGEDVGGRAGFERVTELAPGEPSAWANLGLLALRRNDFEEAGRLLGRANEMAPESAHVEMLLGLLAAAQGSYAEAADHYERAYALDSTNVKAAYALALESERQATPESEAQALTLIQNLSTAHPQNLALAIERVRLALKRQDAAGADSALERLQAFSADWPTEVVEQLNGLRTAVSSDDLRAASTRLAFLRNLLLQQPSYRQDLAAIQTPAEQPGDFITGFIKLPDPPRSPAPADSTTHFTAVLDDSIGSGATHTGVLYATGESGPSVWYLRGSTISVGDDFTSDFPGDASQLPVFAHPVAGLDYNYDYSTDLALAGPGGFRLLRGDGAGGFDDVTADLGLNPSVISAAYHSVWPFDGDLEGDLDLLLAQTSGPPVVLRNNGDGTYAPGETFGDVDGIRSFAWADLDQDADPDAAFVDGAGTLHVYFNDRSGMFRRSEALSGAQAAAIAVADIDSDGRFELLVLAEDGAVSIAGEDGEPVTGAPGIAGGDALLAADLDNNGSLDLIASGPEGTAVHLNGENGFAGGPGVALSERIVDVADLDGDGRLDLIALGSEGAATLRNEGSAPYRWQVLRPRSAQATGDQRINSFGIGGQIEVRSGLLFQKQPIASPQVHFGLGTHESTDVARIIWPNGDVQAEFDLSTDQPLLTQQRLKGSCPWVFTYDGEGMTFVTDFIWRSPLGLAINGQEQAGVVLTADRVKIDGDQLVPRDGIYDVRITAELWETHFFDQVSLIAVDHPKGTEIFVDERFSIPPPDLEPKVMSELRPVRSAFDESGTDVTATVAEVDEVYLGTFTRGRYQGVAEDHFVEIHLGEDVPRTGSVWLVAQGWVRPTDSSVNVALSQGGSAAPRSLQLEAMDERGIWQLVADNLGFPAGKTKSLLFPIGDVLAAYPSARFRLRTNLEIYWDAIHWAEGRASSDVSIREIHPSVANLLYRGYSEVTVDGPSSPEIPHYDRFRSSTRQWFDLEGYYTRFGDVRPLLRSVDDRYLIMNAGDEIRFEFPALPPPAEGYVRDFLLQGDGWVKDGDFNTAFSRTVRPLPLHADTGYRGPLVPLQQDPGYLLHPSDWVEYHTRYVAPDGFAEMMAVE